MELQAIREQIRDLHRKPEKQLIEELIASAAPDEAVRQRAASAAVDLVKTIRSDSQLSMMEVFMAEYGLSTQEGVALMCLAEALLRVPDADTMDALIEDKIAPSDWAEHVGDSDSSLVNASTIALLLAGKVLEPEPRGGIAATIHNAVRRLGEPVIRAATKQAMKMLGEQFVLGRTIEEAVSRGRKQEKCGFSFSYDMLGEAAMTAADADSYFLAYKNAITYLARQNKTDDIRQNSGISIKLSALHPRYEDTQAVRVMRELAPKVLELALLAKGGNMGLNIDAEEADRLDLSLDIIEAVLRDERLRGWDGFGVVVQAYGKRAAAVIDWLYALAGELGRSIMVRLVKGAYWDTEIKQAQVDGVEDFPVFTRKIATDVSYLCCAQKLLGMTDRIYPQFASHNAHTVASILEMADGGKPFEFQRLHGMGEALLNTIMEREGARCRIYAPVGAHKDLLAYLVRRLLENGANSSFVNQIVDHSVPAEQVAADPFEEVAAALDQGQGLVIAPSDLFGPERRNSNGWDLSSKRDREAYTQARKPFENSLWHVEPMLAGDTKEATSGSSVVSPANPDDKLGTVREAGPEDVRCALAHAQPWLAASVIERARCLRAAADLYEEHSGELFALLAREAGKTAPDAVAEVREAVDFLRYYAAQAEKMGDAQPCGLFTCISPWNFPLAIFTGQIAAALAAGNGVLAKPAETTPLIAGVAVKLMHQAGVPSNVLQLLPGAGAVVGGALVSAPETSGVCFTGSTATAQQINRAMAANLAADAPLIAETGGINAMIVDSTALAEQAVRDIVASAFQSAGQRCSALRILYLQEDIADQLLEMLYGAMDELKAGSPLDFDTDFGPVIDQNAQLGIMEHISVAQAEGRVLKQVSAPGTGYFVPPTVISVAGIEEMEREIFGPVLHVARFRADKLDAVIDAVNDCGYGLTFGLHTRINDRVEHIRHRVRVGNIYVNRNQIGAVVGSQPFGGEGLSGTGPKAGGPHYLRRFLRPETVQTPQVNGAVVDEGHLQTLIRDLANTNCDALATVDMPGPTGELNQLSTYGRGVVLCLGPTPEMAEGQAETVRSLGCQAVMVVPGARGAHAVDGFLPRACLEHLEGVALVALWSDRDDQSEAWRFLARRSGPLIPLSTGRDLALLAQLERHACIDTTAAGGNAALLATSS